MKFTVVDELLFCKLVNNNEFTQVLNSSSLPMKLIAVNFDDLKFVECNVVNLFDIVNSPYLINLNFS